jgi:hypothetical protein
MRIQCRLQVRHLKESHSEGICLETRGETMNENALNAESSRRRRKEVTPIRSVVPALCLMVSLGAVVPSAYAESNPRLQTFFEQNVGLGQDQIDDIRRGIPVVKTFPPRTPTEVFLFGAVYIHATPESYLRYVLDFERMRRIPNYLELGVFGNPPKLSDLSGLSLDSEDIRELQKCRPGDCVIQLPGATMEELQRSIDWSVLDVDQQVDQFLQHKALNLLRTYQKDGNRALGIYEDKSGPAPLAQEFAYMLSYSRALPAELPDFYSYLLTYPDAKSPNIDDQFYWAKVKFGLRPTLRMVHLVTMRGNVEDDVAYALAEKQLYASHYFDTALDLTFCVRDRAASNHPGFYLIMAMGTEQLSLVGLKGEFIREVAVKRSAANLQAALTNIRNALEGNVKP